MKISTYLRVSTDQQDVESQRLELAKFAAGKGWEIVAEYSDVMSGRKATRPGLEAALADASQGKFAGLVAVRIDRFSRSTSDFLALCKRAERLGVGLVCSSQPIDTLDTSPIAIAMRQLLAVFAELDCAMIRERTKAGLAAAKARGVELGRRSRNVPKNWPEIVKVWRDTGTGYGELANMLGGCAKSTAWGLANGRLRK